MSGGEERPDILAVGDEPWPEEELPGTLVELINRVLDRGVVVGGDVTLSLAGVDLAYVGLSALLTSVSTAREVLGRDVGTRPLPPAPGAGGGRGGRSMPGPAPRRTLRPAAPDAEPGRPPDPGAPDAEPMQAALASMARALPERVDIDPDDVQRDLARLVLTVVELLRRIVEHQALRRMDDPDLTEEQVERMGLALQRLDEKLEEIRGVFGLAEGELNVDLGPLGKLL